MSMDPEQVRTLAEAIGVGRARHHIFLCADQTKPKCAPREATAEVWAYLKRRVVELGLLDDAKPCVLRTKADCLRVCADGPLCVVYPEGIWYRGVTVPVMERILQEHILGGTPVEEHVIQRAPLPGGAMVEEGR